MNPNQSETKSELIRIIPISNSFGLKIWFRIGSNSFELLPRIKSDYVGSIFYHFSLNEIQNFFRIGS